MVETEQSIFSSGGTLELADSSGVLEIVGWDQPEVQLVVTKTARHRYAQEDLGRAVDALDRILVSTQALSDSHLLIRTEFPSRSLLRPIHGKSDVKLTYTIHVPRQTRLIVKHDAGEVKVHDVAANMLLSNRVGHIDVTLPGDERYSIDAKAKSGAVNSDYTPALSACESDALAPHLLHLRVGTGEITVRKLRLESALSGFGSH